jgi:hypothetical protein
VVKSYSWTVEPAELCAVILSVYRVSGIRSSTENRYAAESVSLAPAAGLTLLLTRIQADASSSRLFAAEADLGSI